MHGAQELDPRSVLLVDDDETLRRVLADALSARGFSVRQAACTKTGATLAREHAPAWAVVDLKMRGATGLALLRDLRLIDPRTRVVVLSGNLSVAAAAEAARMGAAGYLCKPVDADELAEALSGLAA